MTDLAMQRGVQETRLNPDPTTAMGLQINGMLQQKAGSIEQRTDARDTGRYALAIASGIFALIGVVSLFLSIKDLTQ